MTVTMSQNPFQKNCFLMILKEYQINYEEGKPWFLQSAEDAYL